MSNRNRRRCPRLIKCQRPIQFKESDRLTVNLLLLVLHVLNGGKVESGFVREQESSGLEVLVPRDKNGVQHGLVKKEVAHPLRDDDIELLDRQLDFLELALDEGDGCY